MKKFISRPYFLFKYNFTGFLLALLVLVFTFYLFHITNEGINNRELRRFEYRTELATRAIKNRMLDYFQILKGVKGLLVSSDSITRSEWKRYYESLNINETYPGIQGIGLATYVESGSEKKLIESIRNEGFKDFQIIPPGKRPIYTPIVYLEPFEGRNLRAFGYDMFSEPTRRKAMEVARDKNIAAITGKVTLVQETEVDVQPGFLLYLPVYKGNTVPSSIEERRKKIIGFAYSPFRAGDLMSNLLKNYDYIDIEIYDGEIINKESLLYDKDSFNNYSNRDLYDYSKVVKFDIAGRTWSIFYSSLPGFSEKSTDYPSYLILIGGCTITVLIFLILFYFSKSQQSSYLKQLITDQATAAIFTVDSEGYCTFVNPAASKMTGYSIEEIKNQPLYHSLYNGSIVSDREPEIHSAARNFREIRDKEDVFIRKDGKAINVSYSVRPIHYSGKPISTLVEVRDITEEKKSKQALIDTANQLKMINTDLDNFIYTASHDLRAPIANLEGLMNGLNKTAVVKLDTYEKKLLDMVGLSINRLKRTITDLTEITKAQKDVEKEKEKISFNEVLEDVKADLNTLIKDSNPEFRVSFHVEYINYSKKDIRSILYNLVSNALKYKSPERPLKINIRTYRENNLVVLELADNGLGIKPEYQKKLFMMFKRIHTHVEGSGIGLYILKRILENKGGKIEVDSEEGRGTIFKVYFNTV
jgi:PAS domain S-box-containing protein